MKLNPSKEIAKLINRRNNLPNKIPWHSIRLNEYFYLSIKNIESNSKKIVACVRARRMSFFVYELKHLCVLEEYEGRGLGNKMIDLVEQQAKLSNTPLIMATTNAINDPINHILQKKNFEMIKSFENKETLHICNIWQKQVF